RCRKREDEGASASPYAFRTKAPGRACESAEEGVSQTFPCLVRHEDAHHCESLLDGRFHEGGAFQIFRRPYAQPAHLGGACDNQIERWAVCGAIGQADDIEAAWVVDRDGPER